MAGFEREKDVDRRRSIITEARHKGSVPPDVREALEAAIAGGEISWHQTRVLGLDVSSKQLNLNLEDGAQLVLQRILLATGFVTRRPGGDFVDQLAESASLPCARCGYPVVDQALRWHPRIYVSGPLAELELGPASRNIAGARRAAERLVAVASSSSNQRLGAHEQ